MSFRGNGLVAAVGGANGNCSKHPDMRPSAGGREGEGWAAEGCVGGACPGLQMHLARGRRPQLAHAAGAAMNSSRREDALLMSPGGYLATSGVLFLIGFVGCFANLFVIVLFAKNKQVRAQLFTPLAF